VLLRPVQALETIEPRLPPSCLSGTLSRLVAPDVLLGAGDELLLFLILLELPRPPFGAEMKVAPVRSGVVLQPAERQVERPACNPVQEISVVRNNQERTSPGTEKSLQPVQHPEIEVIRRFIEQQEIGVR
jgi:hypothetical protein